MLRLGRCHSILSFGFVLLIQDKLEHILRGCHKNVTGCGKKVKVGGEGEANLHLNYQDRLFCAKITEIFRMREMSLLT